jgi:hypothetical protein
MNQRTETIRRNQPKMGAMPHTNQQKSGATPSPQNNKEEKMYVVYKQETSINKAAPVALGIGCGRADVFDCEKEELADSMSLKR